MPLFKKQNQHQQADYASPYRPRPHTYAYIPTSKQATHAQVNFPSSDHAPHGFHGSQSGRGDSNTRKGSYLFKPYIQSHHPHSHPHSHSYEDSSASDVKNGHQVQVSHPIPYVSTKEQEALLGSAGATFRVRIADPAFHSNAASFPSSTFSSAPAPAAQYPDLGGGAGVSGSSGGFRLPTSNSNCSLAALPPTPNPTPHPTFSDSDHPTTHPDHPDPVGSLPTLGSAIQIIEPAWRAGGLSTSIQSNDPSNAGPSDAARYAQDAVRQASQASQTSQTSRASQVAESTQGSFQPTLNRELTHLARFPSPSSFSSLAHAYLPSTSSPSSPTRTRNSLDTTPESGYVPRSSGRLGHRFSFDGIPRSARRAEQNPVTETILATPWSIVDRPDPLAEVHLADPHTHTTESNEAAMAGSGSQSQKRGSKLNLPSIKVWGAKLARLGDSVREKDRTSSGDYSSGSGSSSAFGTGQGQGNGHGLRLGIGREAPPRRSSVPLGSIDTSMISHPVIIIHKDNLPLTLGTGIEVGPGPGAGAGAGGLREGETTAIVAPALSRPSSYSRSSRPTSPRIPPPRPYTTTLDSGPQTPGSGGYGTSQFAQPSQAGERRHLLPPHQVNEVNQVHEVDTLSPARDDTSVLDDMRTPFSFPLTPASTEERRQTGSTVALATTTATATTNNINMGRSIAPSQPRVAFPLRARNLTDADEADMETTDADASTGTSAHTQTRTEIDGQRVSREHSLSELREAFTRMRHLSLSGGGDNSSCFTISESSRRGSTDSAPFAPLGTSHAFERSANLDRLDETLLSLLQGPSAGSRYEHRYPPTLAVKSRDSGMLTAPPPSRSISASTDTSRVSSVSGVSAETASNREDGDGDDAEDGDTESLDPRDGDRRRTRSRSMTTDSMASTCDMIAATEMAQGTGWWSVPPTESMRSMPPVPSVPSSSSLLQGSATVVSQGAKDGERRETELELGGSGRTVSASSGGTDARIDRLEQAARASTLPSRTRFAPDPVERNAGVEGQVTQTRPRPRSVFHGPRPSLVAENIWQVDTGNSIPIDLSAPAPAIVDPKTAPRAGTNIIAQDNILAESVPSPMRSTMQSSSTLNNSRSNRDLNLAAGLSDSNMAKGHETEEDTPTRPRPRSRATVSRDSPLRSHLLSSTQSRPGASPNRFNTPSSTSTPTKRAPSSLAISTLESDATITALKAKHSLEVDALLAALSGSVSEARDLHNELGRVRVEWNEIQRERDGLKVALKEAQRRLGASGERDGQGEGSGRSTKGKVGLNIAGVDVEEVGRGQVDEFGRIERR